MLECKLQKTLWQPAVIKADAAPWNRLYHVGYVPDFCSMLLNSGREVPPVRGHVRAPKETQWLTTSMLLLSRSMTKVPTPSGLHHAPEHLLHLKILNSGNVHAGKATEPLVPWGS